MNAMKQKDKLPEATPRYLSVHILSKQQYESLETQAMAGQTVRADTTPVQAGYIAGIEHVLRMIRKGFATA